MSKPKKPPSMGDFTQTFTCEPDEVDGRISELLKEFNDRVTVGNEGEMKIVSVALATAPRGNRVIVCCVLARQR